MAMIGALHSAQGSCFLHELPASASTTEVIYSLAGEGDGEYTDTDLVIDQAGIFTASSVLGPVTFGGGHTFFK